MTNEQLRIALTANSVTKQTRNHFGFSDPCGKTLEEYNKSAMLCCMTAAQRMNTPGFERVLAAQIFPCFTIGCWNQTKTVYDFDYEFQKMLMDTDAGTGFMHESFHKNDPKNFTRSWFAWTNTLFGELILNTIKEYPNLLSQIL